MTYKMHSNLIVCKQNKTTKMQSEKNEVSFISRRFTQHKKNLCCVIFQNTKQQFVKSKDKKKLKNSLIKSLKNVE